MSETVIESTQLPELLTVDQFAQLLKVSRTTVFSWLKTGIILEGVDYFRIGRILRFWWREGLFFNSQQKPLLEDEGLLSPPQSKRGKQDFQRGNAPVNSRPLLLKRDPRPVINLDY